MPEQTVKVPVPGLGVIEGRPVGITESVERWTELRLEDGSVLRVKPAVVKVFRADNRYDNEGNPLYVVQGGQVMIVSHVEEHLRKPPNTDSKVQ